jgi:DNA-binding transcriptional regulator YiaG
MLDKPKKHTGLSRYGYPLSMPSQQLALIDMPKKEKMGARIRRLREEQNLTIDQMAQACGVSKSAVCQWELGQSENIRLYPFTRLMRLLGVSHEYLLFGPDEEAPEGFWLDEGGV